jgi:Ubiquitin family
MMIDIPLNVDTSDTIGILKAKITAKERLPAEKLVLIFAGKILSDGTPSPVSYIVTLEDTLEKCNIEKESCIHVVQRVAGQVAPTGQRNGAWLEDYSPLIQY